MIVGVLLPLPFLRPLLVPLVLNPYMLGLLFLHHLNHISLALYPNILVFWLMRPPFLHILLTPHLILLSFLLI